MPGRQSHGRHPPKASKVRVRSKKRALDAFSIASHQNPDKTKIRLHRLGVSEDENRPRKKRTRDKDEDEEEEEESQSKKQRKGPGKSRIDEPDVDEGSDSEGNNWRLGQVDSGDDSDLDSDEAFGESDEERFDGFTFGIISDKKGKRTSSKTKDLNLDEDNDESDSVGGDDSLGEDAIDLATMLDQTEGDSDDEPGSKQKARNAKQLAFMKDDEDEPSSHTSLSHGESDTLDEADRGEDSDDESSVSSSVSSSEDETLDPAKLVAIQDMITSLPQTTESDGDSKKRPKDTANEYRTPRGFPVASKLSSSEGVAQSDESTSKGKSAAKSLAVPVPRRQQRRLDRSAAYDKTKKTLERWTDTVKHNRRADHLIFPLPDNDSASAHANTRLQPTTQAKPFNELEATIQSILEESGLAAANGKDDEDRIREFEELETNKMSIEEVKARRDQLRMARDLLFREEAKAKRIKKIKSKSYRKVHRRQREKEERLNKEALAEGGFVPSEDETEAQDRRRAEERMGAKHRGSKWAKSTKESGRAAWDEDARAGITAMARRDEELRKRVDGRSVGNEFDGNSSASLSDSDGDASEEDDRVEQQRVLRQLDKAGKGNSFDESAPGGKLANMKFMLKAEAARKKQNDMAIEDIRKGLAGEESSSEEDDGDVGRRIFGPRSNKSKEKAPESSRNEFEEPTNSDDDGADSIVDIHGLDNTAKGNTVIPIGKKVTHTSEAPQLLSSKPFQDNPSEGGAWSNATPKSSITTQSEARRRQQKRNDAVEVEELDLSKTAVIASRPKTKNSAKKTTIIDIGSGNESDDDDAVRLPFAIRDQDLIKRAFSGADVVGEFEAEKKQTIEDDEEKIIDNTLPGWGTWTGSGLSKKEKVRNKGRFVTKSEGIKEKNRKDAKLERVIINEKRVKKNGKYLASSLPHPFETRQQYERSLRLPVGPEWATKETFQEATKPRILLKQGIIAPMSKPLL